MAITITRKKLIILVASFVVVLTTVVLGAILFVAGRRPQTLNITSCLPAFRDGGGPYYKPNSPFRSKIVPDQNNGDKLVVSGSLLNSDCTRVVADAVIDIWQANETGEYADEWYRGQITTDANGHYSFESIIPKGYGEGTGYRPPHIHFKVFMDGKEIVTSQMFFGDVKGKPGFEEEYIIPLVKQDDGYYGNYNIVLPDYR